MRKSGLHKQISSIFDGVTVPQNGILPENAELSAESTEPAAQETQQTPMPQTSGSSQGQQMVNDASGTASISVLQVGRPMPLPKSEAISKSTMKPSLPTQLKKAISRSYSSLDPQQKKASVLVGILSVVFGVVMFVSLGGAKGPQTATANNTQGDQAAKSRTTAKNWKTPNPLPQNMRNATSLAIAHSATQQKDSAAGDGSLVVRGIVFSKNKPSAIINNQILSEGQSFNGVKLVKITKETVEFEANGKRWTQPVQR